MALVPYEKMGEVFDDKPILVFTYREHKFSFIQRCCIDNIKTLSSTVPLE